MTSESSKKLESSLPGPLVGVCLCDETNTCLDQVIGTVYISPESCSQTLVQFRNEIASTLSYTLGHLQYVFLTSNGWEINEKLEGLVKLSNIVTDEGKVNICLSHDKPRFGIVIEGSPDMSIGFVFCDPTCSLSNLHSVISSQLPGVYRSLPSNEFCFLDRNTWPISKDQESMLTVMEISSSHTIKIRCNKYYQSRNASIIDERSEFPDTRFSSINNNSHSLGPHNRITMSPINEHAESADQQWPLSSYTDVKVSTPGIDSFDILLSYVHTEAATYALLLKNALEDLDYSVFLDIHCIEGGKDWQDVLNDAITNCSIFIPLITLQYGQTLWTNREVKLADVLGKLILPINFNKKWPPKCLAIQFATTQYIPGNKLSPDVEVTPDNFTERDAFTIAEEIADRYQKDKECTNTEVDSIPGLSRQSTEIIEDEILSPSSSAGLKLSSNFSFTRRRSAIKSYASNLPESIPKHYRMSVFESRAGKPLIVISCCQKQREFAKHLIQELSKKECEVWCSCDISDYTDEEKSTLFQQKVNEAGTVIFILSKEFADDTFCEQQVYYCEQRKRIIPLIYEPYQMPNWMTTLIGTNTFIDCKSQSYLTTLLDRVMTVLNPQKAGDELKQVIQQKMEMAKLCSELNEKLPEGKHVYISGGTKFYSKCGEAVCKEIGKALARDEEVILITGGFYGVGETIGRSFFEERKCIDKPHGVYHIIPERDEQDKSTQTRQNPNRTFPPVPYGETLFFGSSVRQRETLTPRVIDLCILVEGGPGAAFEAQQFVWNGNCVIPIRVTGGAAGGFFNVPSSILMRPPGVSESDWSVLGDENASPSEIASAVVRIVKIMKNPEISLSGIRSRSNTGSGSEEPKIFKRSKVLIRRHETVPVGLSTEDKTTNTHKYVKRTLSEKKTISTSHSIG